MGRKAGGKDGGEAAKKKPKAVVFKKFVSRALDRIGGSDNMELEPKFIADMEQHNKYADALDKMNQAITHLVAPGMMKKTVVGKEEQDKPPDADADAVEKNKKKEEKKEKEKDPPIKLLAAHLQKMAAATNPHDRLAGKVYLQSLDKMGKAFTDLHSMNAEYKVQLNNLLPHIVEHHQSEATFVKNQKRMIQYLDEINLMREDVKKASTTAKVRDVGKQYEHAVNNFDRVAAAVDAVIAADSKGASDHQRDFINVSSLFLIVIYLFSVLCQALQISWERGRFPSENG